MLSSSRTLQTVSLLDSLGAGLIVPQIPNHARQLGCDHLHIGAMVSLYSAFQCLSGSTIGILSDAKGRKNILIICLFLSGISYVFLGITSSSLIFFALRGLLGLFKHTQLLTNAMTPDYEDDQTKVLASRSSLGTLSAIVMCLSPIVGGHFVDIYPTYGFTAIALIAGVLFAVNSVLIRNLPEPDKKLQEKQKSKAKDPPKILSSILTSMKETISKFYTIERRIYSEEFLFKLLLTFCTGLYLSNYAVFLRIKYKVTLKTLGVATSIIWAVQSFCSYFLANINKLYKSDKDFSKRNFHVFCTLTVSLTAMIFAPTASVYIAFVPFVALSSAVGNYSTSEIVLRKTGVKDKGTVLGAASNIKAISGVICPLLAGAIAQYAGSLYVIYVSAAIATLGAYKSYRVQAISGNWKKQN